MLAFLEKLFGIDKVRNHLLLSKPKVTVNKDIVIKFMDTNIYVTEEEDPKVAETKSFKLLSKTNKDGSFIYPYIVEPCFNKGGYRFIWTSLDHKSVFMSYSNIHYRFISSNNCVKYEKCSGLYFTFRGNPFKTKSEAIKHAKIFHLSRLIYDQTILISRLKNKFFKNKEQLDIVQRELTNLKSILLTYTYNICNH